MALPPLSSDGSVSGPYHFCALAANGAVWCWGYGDTGSLGDGALKGSSTPVLVVAGV